MSKQDRVFVTIDTNAGSTSGRGNWIHASKNFIYIARSPGGRAYWMTNKLPLSKRPRVRFNDETLQMKINSYLLHFRKPVEYHKVKNAILSGVPLR